MERSTYLGSSVLVDEIISDALRKLNSGDLLPASEASSMSLLHGGEPRARSTSITNIPGLRGYRSFTEDVLKSFIDRNNSQTSSTLLESDDSSDPFEGMSENQELESSTAFVSGEKLLGEFDKDEKRCREENLFKENRPVALECASIAESPVKLSAKQVPTPDWAKNPVQLDSFSYFAGQPGNAMFGEEASVTSEVTLEENKENERTYCYNPGLPYYLGFVLPGVSNTFELPRLPNRDSKCPLVTKSYLNGKQLPICKTEVTADKLKLHINPPSKSAGGIRITIECPSSFNLVLFASCFSPQFILPTRICVPSNVWTTVFLKPKFAFPANLKLEIQCDLMKSKSNSVTLTPETESIPLEIRTSSGESTLSVTLRFQGQKLLTLNSVLQARDLKISMRSETSSSSLVITNSENFPVSVKLTDNVGFLTYVDKFTLTEGQTLEKDTKSFNAPPGQPEKIVKFQLELLSPVKALLPIHCSHRFPSTQADLRPILPRFLWLYEEETEFSMADHSTGKPAPWRKRVAILPCPIIEKYIKVIEAPNDPTRVVLKISRPSQLVFGRLRFCQRGPEGKPNETPYGFRYLFIVPQKANLRWHTVAGNTGTNIYQLPIDGKLKVTNTIAQDVFLVTPESELIIPAEKSIELSIRKPCRLHYGLEAWRQLVKAKTLKHLKEIKEMFPSGIDPARMLADFPQEKSSFFEKRLLEMIPSDSQSSVRLYQVFTATLDSVELHPVAENGTFFVR